MSSSPGLAASTDRIEREVIIQAPRARVWRALSNAEEFGDWFGASLRGQVFASGQRVKGPITYPGYEHVLFDAMVERVEPERMLSFRWHPYAVDASVDYSAEPRTLVTFELEDAKGGTLLRVTESGFDAIPVGRRLDAFRMNSQGWEAQMNNIVRHVAAG